jgi:hypothetical protein
VPVTDEQMVWLQAFLAGEMKVAQRVSEQAAQPAQAASLGALVYAAFGIAARQKFAPAWTRGEVIRFVGQVRAALAERPDALPPLVAEQQLRSALGGQVAADSGADSDAEAKAHARIILLDALVQSLDLDDASIASLLDQAREDADQILASLGQ